MEYCIQPGDNFHGLAQRWGGTCDDFIQVNPNVDPMKLQIGQKIVLPAFIGVKGLDQYAEISLNQGQEFVGDYLDAIEMEVEGVHIRLRRIGEPKIPHEIHFLMPRTEIHKVQPVGEGGPTDIQIMLSNVDIVLSPRLTSGKGDTAEQAKGAQQIQGQQTQGQLTQTLQTPGPQFQGQQTP